MSSAVRPGREVGRWVSWTCRVRDTFEEMKESEESGEEVLRVHPS